jgi:hypothetical protein
LNSPAADRSIGGEFDIKKQKARRECRAFFYFFFCASDRMRSSNFRNSAVSSSMLLEGRFWKGITSDMVEPPLGYDRAAPVILPAIGAFLRHGSFSRDENLP